MRRALLLLAALAVPGAHATTKGGTPLALVTAETENQLVAVELPSGRIVRRLHMPADPQNVVANDRVAVVVSTRAGAVTLVDPRRLTVTRILRGFGAPHIPALSPGGRYAYVTDDARGQLVTIDLARKQIASRLFVGVGAHHMAFRPHHHELWIVLGERARAIHIVDTTDPARPRRLGWFSPPGGGLMHDLAFPAGGRRVWITYDDRPIVDVFELRTRRRLITLAAGSPPQHVAFRRYAYVTSGNDGTLRRFSVAGRLLDVATTPAGSFNLDAGPTGMILTSSLSNGTLTALGSGGRTIRELRVAPAARDVTSTIVP